VIYHGAEIAGFREAMLDATPTETCRKFKEITDRDGLKAATRWRESQFG